MGWATAAGILGAGATLWGAKEDRDAAKESAEQQMAQREKSLEYIKDQTEKARGDIFKLFPSAQQSRQQGIQAGLDLYGQTIPQQMQAFQQGNVRAQDQIAAGLPQANQAILGGPIDYGAFQPQQVRADFSVPQQAPQFQGIQDLMGPQQPQTQERQPAEWIPRSRGIDSGGFFSLPRQGPGG